MKVDDMFPIRFVKGRDLTGPVTVTISKIQSEQAFKPTKGMSKIWVLYTQESKTGKGIVLNKTLANQIAQALGSDETDDWLGKRITLYPQPVQIGGEPLTAIRARGATEKSSSAR